MKKLVYNISIAKPAVIVYDIMLGISDKGTYEEWTAIFSPTSTYEGSWDSGSKMLLISLDDKGNPGGMVSKILKNEPNKFVSIQHNGILRSGKEILRGPEVDEWAGGLENYYFKEDKGMTEVTIEIDSSEEYEEYMDKLYPNALQSLKELCERAADVS